MGKKANKLKTKLKAVQNQVSKGKLYTQENIQRLKMANERVVELESLLRFVVRQRRGDFLRQDTSKVWDRINQEVG